MLELRKRTESVVPFMAEQERLASIVFRENLLLLVKACALRLGQTRGSRQFMAAIIPTSPQHLSDLMSGKKGATDKYKARIENSFTLPKDWLDTPHPGMRPAELLKYVPSPEDVPASRRDPIPVDPRDVQRRIVDLQRQIDELASSLGPRRNNPK